MSPKMPRTILVTGATGRQGGGVIKALSNDPNFELLALTRDATSPSAQKLKKSADNIKLVQGDLTNVQSVFENARKATQEPIWGVYSVQAKPPGNVSDEITQGNSVIDEAIASGVSFFVYSSVDRGGPVASSSDPTNVPHWATKYQVEKHLEEKAAGTNMRYTVLRPTAFMENLSNDFQGKTMIPMWEQALKDKPLQMIATKDIGFFAALAFKSPDEYAGRYLSLAGASITVKEAGQIYESKFGKEIPRTYGIVGHLVLHAVKDIGAMFKWLGKNNNGADIDECRRLHPGLMDLGTWFERESQFRQA